LYVGGTFVTAGGVTVNRIAKWDVATSTWSALIYNTIGGVNDYVYSLAFDSTRNVLYVGGIFTTAGGVTVNRIAKWDVATSTWSALIYNTNIGVSANVNSSAFDSTNNVLYVGGVFTTAGGVTVNRIAKWDVATSTWSAVNLGITITIGGPPESLYFANNALYIGVTPNALSKICFPYFFKTFNNVSENYTNKVNGNSLYYYNN
jgi:hypothetical protein